MDCGTMSVARDRADPAGRTRPHCNESDTNGREVARADDPVGPAPCAIWDTRMIGNSTAHLLVIQTAVAGHSVAFATMLSADSMPNR